MPDKSEYSRNLRQRFAAKLAKLIAPSGSGATLQAINDAMFPHLADMPDSAFNAHMPALIATKCTALPDAAELRRLLLDALAKTTGAQSAHDGNGRPAKPPMPVADWLYARIMTECGNRPGPMLRAWLEAHGREHVAEPEPIPIGPWDGEWEHGTVDATFANRS